MTTVEQMINKIRNDVGMYELSSTASLTSLIGAEKTLYDMLVESQHSIMRDIKGFEPIELIKESSISIAIGENSEDLPTDLYLSRLEYLYHLDSDDVNDGFIEILTKSDYDKFSTKLFKSTVCVYPYSDHLYFSDTATVAHDMKLVYIQEPASLDSMADVISLPEAYDELYYCKTLTRWFVMQDSLEKANYFDSLYKTELKKLKSDATRLSSKTVKTNKSLIYWGGTF